MAKKHTKVKKKKNTILNLLILICAVVFLFSAFKLVSYYFEYKKMDAVYAGINDSVLGETDFDPNSEGLLKEAPSLNMDELLAINPEIVGYILIPDTKIAYPIAHSDDPIKYLNYDIQSNRSRSGAIFIDPNNAVDFSDGNTIIYGHNMYDGSMFGTLANYLEDQEYYEHHSYIYIYTLNEVRLYRIFSTQLIKQDDEVYTLNFTSHEALLDFIKAQANRSSVTPVKVPNDTKNIIMLSTCHSSTAQEDRTVILAYLVDTLQMP